MNIWVNGCFDILHSGHIDLLWYAKLYNTKDMSYSDAIVTNKLIVGLDSDDRIRELKGKNRPINESSTRIRIMSNLRMVDDVLLYHNEKEMEFFIGAYNIDYIVIGDQYSNKRVVGAEYSKNGVIFYPITTNFSSSNVIEKIKLCI